MNVQHPFAVRRITDGNGTLRRYEISNILLVNGNAWLNTGAPAVFFCKCNRLRINVIAESFECRIMLDVCNSLCTGIAPGGLRNLFPFFCQESPVQTWCHAHGLKGGFNQKRSAAAERVADNAVRMHSRQIYDSSGQCFFDRCCICVPAVATFMKSDSGSVQINGCNIFADGKLNRMRRTGFFKPTGVINRFQALNSRLFDNRLAVRNTVQLGIQRVAFYRKCIIFTNPLLQRKRPDSLKQFFEIVRLKLSQLYQNTLGGREADICLCQNFGIAAE